MGARDTPPDSRSSLATGQMIGVKVENMTRREGGPAITSTEIPVKIGKNTKWISGVNEQTKCGVRFCLVTCHVLCVCLSGHPPECSQCLRSGAGGGGGVASLCADGGVAGRQSDAAARHAHPGPLELLGGGAAQCLLCGQENPESQDWGCDQGISQ